MATTDPISSYLSPVSLDFQTIPANESAGKHTATVIFLHGLGDSGAGIWQYANQLSADPALAHVKWIVPDAPKRPVTGNMGYVMPSWFDCLSFDIFTRAEDEPSLFFAVQTINLLITSEITQHGIPAERIIIGGPSQGGALSCLTGVTSERRLGGVFMLSSYVPLWRTTKRIAKPPASSIPFFWGHGTNDPQVNHDKAFEAASNLARDLEIPIHKAAAGEDVGPLSAGDPGIRFHSYEGLVHWIDPVDELTDLGAWIRGVLPVVEEAGSG